MESSELKTENLAMSSGIQMVKSALGLIPGMAPIVDLYSNYQRNVQYNNIVDVLQKHSDQIRLISDILLDKLYVNSHLYAKDLLITVQKAKDEFNEEKRTVFASYLTACCHTENSNNPNKNLFLDYIARLDYLDIFILKHLAMNYNGKNIVEHCTTIYNDEHDIKVSEFDIQIHVEHLSSIGVIERCEKEEVERYNQRSGNVQLREKNIKRLNFYQRTYLGDGIYSFLKKAEPTN